jgi:hypothetical protein
MLSTRRGLSAPARAPSVARHQAAGWAKLGIALAVVAAEITDSILHPWLAEVLAITDVIIPVMAALVVFTVVVRGSPRTVDRVFRLLRWAFNRPEPASSTGGPWEYSTPCLVRPRLGRRGDLTARPGTPGSPPSSAKSGTTQP